MDKQYDLIVVGSGILGTMHAYHALAVGKKVLMIEKDRYPIQASVRNFGMVIPSGMSGEWFRYGLIGTSLYKHIQEAYDISVRNNGTLYIASDDDEQSLIHDLKEHYDHIGYPCELMTQKAISEKHPVIRSSYAREALFFPQEISVEPDILNYRLHEYLKTTFKQFTLRSSSPVVACEALPDGAQVKTSEGDYLKASKVIVASGHEFRLLFPALFREQALKVSKLQMMRLHPIADLPLEGNIATGLSIRRYESFAECPSYAHIKTPEHLLELQHYGIHILFKKAIDGSLIVGDSHEYAAVGQEETLGYGLSEKINGLMQQEAARIVNFDVSALKESWAGYYSQHESLEIFEHIVDKHILIATGIGGKGMTCSAGYAAEKIQQLFS